MNNRIIRDVRSQLRPVAESLRDSAGTAQQFRYKRAMTSGARYRTVRTGFTLLELLAVVAIIGILVGILMPVSSRVRTRARIRKAESEVHGIAAAIRAYHAEYSRWPVPAAYLSGDGIWSNNNQDVLAFLVGKTAGDLGNTRRTSFFEASSDLTGPMCDPFPSNLPYRIQVSAIGNYVKVWSCGTNCVDNAGAGDDITARY